MNDTDRRGGPLVWLFMVALCHLGLEVAAADTRLDKEVTSSPMVGKPTPQAGLDMPIAGSETHRDAVDHTKARDGANRMLTAFVQDPPEGRRRGQRRGPGQGQGRGRGARRGGSDDAPKTGEEAPGFTLKMLESEKKVSLATFRGKRPVILFFGSYT